MSSVVNQGTTIDNLPGLDSSLTPEQKQAFIDSAFVPIRGTVNNVATTYKVTGSDLAAAGENKIDSISVNGSPVAPDANKNVALTIPAEQVQADWNQTTTTSKDYIKNKPTVVEGVGIYLAHGSDVDLPIENGKIFLNFGSGALSVDEGGSIDFSCDFPLYNDDGAAALLYNDTLTLDDDDYLAVKNPVPDPAANHADAEKVLTVKTVDNVDEIVWETPQGGLPGGGSTNDVLTIGTQGSACWKTPQGGGGIPDPTGIPDGSVLTIVSGVATWVSPTPPSPSLPANTLRFRFSDANYNPDTAGVGKTQYITATWTKVQDSEYNDWDWTCNDTNWGVPEGQYGGDTPFYEAFKRVDEFGQPQENPNIVDIIDAGDTSSVTNMCSLFYGCNALRSVCLFDTSNVTDASNMFGGGSECDLHDGGTPFLLDTLPEFDFSSVTNFDYALSNLGNLKIIPDFNLPNVTSLSCTFAGCYNVESGALSMYQKLNALGAQVIDHYYTFGDCGMDTVTGATELAQIPSDWK